MSTFRSTARRHFDTSSFPCNSRLPNDLPGVFERVIATVQSTLRRTHAEGGEGAELRLIQSKEDIERPTITLRAEPLKEPSDIKGIIFDMDGTITAPNQINFQRIRERLGIPSGEDILTSIEKMPEAEKPAALRVVEEEEMKGFVDIRLQPGAERVIEWLRHEKELEVALATRNNEKCVKILLERCFAWGPDKVSFAPILTRLSKSEVDVDKIMAICGQWQLPPASVLVVGDSLGR